MKKLPLTLILILVAGVSLGQNVAVVADADTGAVVVPAALEQRVALADTALQSVDADSVGLGNVENVALSTWAGSAAITTLGTVTTGDISAIAPAAPVASVNAATGVVVLDAADVGALPAAATVDLAGEAVGRAGVLSSEFVYAPVVSSRPTSIVISGAGGPDPVDGTYQWDAGENAYVSGVNTIEWEPSEKRWYLIEQDAQWGAIYYAEVFPTRWRVRGQGIEEGYNDPATGVGMGGAQLGDDAFYLGDPYTNGSWRITRSGTGLVMQVRTAGSWVTRQTITASP